MSKENVFVLESFIAYMEEQGLSRETIKSYAGNVERYFRWCKESFGKIPDALYRANVRDFKSYLLNVRRFEPPTVNYYLSALAKLCEYLIEHGVQDEIVVRKNDYITIQAPTTNPWDGVTVSDGVIIGLDNRYALELVRAGDVLVEYDKLIDRQLERAAITSISGFGKICDGASLVLNV